MANNFKYVEDIIPNLSWKVMEVTKIEVGNETKC